MKIQCAQVHDDGDITFRIVAETPFETEVLKGRCLHLRLSGKPDCSVRGSTMFVTFFDVRGKTINRTRYASDRLPTQSDAQKLAERTLKEMTSKAASRDAV